MARAAVPKTLTHAECAQGAAAHLVLKNRLVFDECTWGDWRIDVVAVGRKQVTVVEVKVSRADLKKDFCHGLELAAKVTRADSRLAELERAYARAERDLAAVATRMGFLDAGGEVLDAKIRAYVQLPEFKLANAAAHKRNAVMRALQEIGLGVLKAQTLIAAGMAHQYFICTTPGLMTDAEVPPGWGLLEASSVRSVRVIVPAPKHRVANAFAVRRRWINRAATRCSFEVRALRRKLAERACCTVELR